MKRNDKQLSVLSYQLSFGTLRTMSLSNWSAFGLSGFKSSVLITDKQKTDEPISENRKQRTDNIFRSILVLVKLFIICFFPAGAYAQSPSSGALSVSPAYLEVVLEQLNEEKVIELSYSNNSTQPISLEIYPIDFKQQGEHGGISFLGKESGTYSYSLSSFISLESNNLELDPKEKRSLSIKLKNRQDISPGGHYAAIIARQVQGGRETTVSPAVSALLFMRKTGGERFNLSIQRINWPRFPLQFSIPSSTTITFQNAGNIHVVPYGTIEIKDTFGRLTHKGIINTSSAIVMPESRRLIPATIRNTSFMLPISLNSYQITGNDSLHKVRYTYQESFLYINPRVLIGLLVIIISLIVARKKRNKNHRY